MVFILLSDGLKLLEIVSLLFIIYSGISRKNFRFTMSDVNLIFTSPIRPQNILLYGFLREISFVFAFTIFFLFQIPNLVNNFNQGENSVFLISLMAGGTGLNLTSADIVIHFDPWWNPAVEDQATDRAHRIGQENVVEVIKIIAKGTVEEKILQLQESKRKLVSEIMGDELYAAEKLSSFTEEDIVGLFYSN